MSGYKIYKISFVKLSVLDAREKNASTYLKRAELVRKRKQQSVLRFFFQIYNLINHLLFWCRIFMLLKVLSVKEKFLLYEVWSKYKIKYPKFPELPNNYSCLGREVNSVDKSLGTDYNS